MVYNAFPLKMHGKVTFSECILCSSNFSENGFSGILLTRAGEISGDVKTASSYVLRLQSRGLIMAAPGNIYSNES